MKDNDFNLKRYAELSEKAYINNRFFFSDFLSPDEQSEILNAGLNNASFFGGTEGCERVIAKFGDQSSAGYDEPFPVTTIFAEAICPNFGKELTHRDYLGAIMSLGIERKLTGDIIVNDKGAYIFVHEKIADYICENFVSSGRTKISCKISEIPEGISLYRTESISVNVASLRADCAVSSVFRLSRNKAEAYFNAQSVYINGKAAGKSEELKPGDTVSVRHLGKFRFISVSGSSKKGRLYLDIEKFI